MNDFPNYLPACGKISTISLISLKRKEKPTNNKYQKSLPHNFLIVWL